MTRRSFAATGDGATIAGWVQGEGTPVLMLHGGPGLGYEYLDALVDDLGSGYRLASYQQRGLAPSSVEGPFTVARHVCDMLLVLDELGWDRAVLVGHSWGGHLALHAATRVPERLLAILAVDTLGAVGDGGMHEFSATLMSRTPAEDVERLVELDAEETRGDGTVEDTLEGLRLLWPAYFATREAAPSFPAVRMSASDAGKTVASAIEELPVLEAALTDIALPVGFLAGGASPMPATASTDTAERINGAWVELLDGVGHFPWIEAPGSTRPVLDRLARALETDS